MAMNKVYIRWREKKEVNLHSKRTTNDAGIRSDALGLIRRALPLFFMAAYSRYRGEGPFQFMNQTRAPLALKKNSERRRVSREKIVLMLVLNF